MNLSAGHATILGYSRFWPGSTSENWPDFQPPEILFRSAGYHLLGKLAVPYDVVRGAIGYFRFPEQKTLTGPFNDQQHRAKMFLELRETFGFRTIVETGTFRGATTALFAGLPDTNVYSVELSPFSFGYCWTRFLRNANVAIFLGDSPDTLRKLSRRKLPTPIFFYLDAHWFENLPIALELDIIFGAWSDAIVMIDDFKVEGDDGYAFDDYGDQKRLVFEQILSATDKFAPSYYFPSVAAEEESGARRGSIVILASGLGSAAKFATLRRYDPAN
jgi:hypothetical protein